MEDLCNFRNAIIVLESSVKIKLSGLQGQQLYAKEAERIIWELRECNRLTELQKCESTVLSFYNCESLFGFMNRYRVLFYSIAASRLYSVIIFSERLHIRVLPTLCLVKDGKTKDYIIGFTDLGNTDDFTTEVMEWRIGRADVIEYSGDLLCPPSNGRSGQRMDVHRKKTIRGGKKGDSDDSDSDY